eukprot:TRINITY_DN5897_c0_g1_i1.p4 TRINITY_DN5897_c0_g1~~TRINITY_DN5897_c0_g1_i1.p4  ORF type:complete len:104 (+),score=16.34 TRINITY_DN5897_c0_g1_i1:1077-1388(+)
MRSGEYGADPQAAAGPSIGSYAVPPPGVVMGSYEKPPTQVTGGEYAAAPVAPAQLPTAEITYQPFQNLREEAGDVYLAPPVVGQSAAGPPLNEYGAAPPVATD